MKYRYHLEPEPTRWEGNWPVYHAATMGELADDLANRLSEVSQLLTPVLGCHDGVLFARQVRQAKRLLDAAIQELDIKEQENNCQTKTTTSPKPPTRKTAAINTSSKSASGESPTSTSPPSSGQDLCWK